MTGIAREELPQIAQKDIPAFRKYLKRHGINTRDIEQSITLLKPIQQSINREKVDSLKCNAKLMQMPLLVTSDHYIVDGHHRWVAAKELGATRIKCIECHCPLKQFIQLAHAFGKSFTKSVHEIIQEELQLLVRTNGR